MDIRYGHHPDDVKKYDTDRLRDQFLIEKIFVTGEVTYTYSHVDRIIVGGACPTNGPIKLEAGNAIGAEYFLERREVGIINIGSPGKVVVDGQTYVLGARDGLYIGMGARDISFESDDASSPAKFYFNSAPAHRTYPTVKINIEQATPLHLGSNEESNKRTIYQYVHPNVLESCQLLMGLTVLEPQNVWNTMPCHTHERRMEVYFYFDMEEETRVFHLMGQPSETRHIVVGNESGVISPSWSIHSGVGTRNYTFIWGMVGENQTFTDMDHVPMNELR